MASRMHLSLLKVKQIYGSGVLSLLFVSKLLLINITFDKKKTARGKIIHFFFCLNSSSSGAQEFRMEVMSAPTAAADLGRMGSNLDERAALGSSWPPPSLTPEDAWIKFSYGAIYQHSRRRAV